MTQIIKINADKGKGICVHPNHPDNLRSILQLNCKNACLYFEPCRNLISLRIGKAKRPSLTAVFALCMMEEITENNSY